MGFEIHLSAPNDWTLGISRYDGYDGEMQQEMSYFEIGFILFSISIMWINTKIA